MWRRVPLLPHQQLSGNWISTSQPRGVSTSSNQSLLQEHLPPKPSPLELKPRERRSPHSRRTTEPQDWYIVRRIPPSPKAEDVLEKTQPLPRLSLTYRHKRILRRGNQLKTLDPTAFDIYHNAKLNEIRKHKLLKSRFSVRQLAYNQDYCSFPWRHKKIPPRTVMSMYARQYLESRVKTRNFRISSATTPLQRRIAIKQFRFPLRMKPHTLLFRPMRDFYLHKRKRYFSTVKPIARPNLMRKHEDAEELILDGRVGPRVDALHNQYVSLYTHGTTCFDAIWHAIDHAQVEILYEAYSMLLHDHYGRLDVTGTRTLEKLTMAARRGVFVVLIVDYFGSEKPNEDLYANFRAAGGKVIIFNPIFPMNFQRSPFFRDHRKICVVDGYTGFTGGMNTTDDYRTGNDEHGQAFKDLHLRVIGPSALRLRYIIMETMQEAGYSLMHELPGEAQLLDIITNKELYSDALREAALARMRKASEEEARGKDASSGKKWSVSGADSSCNGDAVHERKSAVVDVGPEQERGREASGEGKAESRNDLELIYKPKYGYGYGDVMGTEDTGKPPMSTALREVGRDIQRLRTLLKKVLPRRQSRNNRVLRDLKGEMGEDVPAVPYRKKWLKIRKNNAGIPQRVLSCGKGITLPSRKRYRRPDEYYISQKNMRWWGRIPVYWSSWENRLLSQRMDRYIQRGRISRLFNITTMDVSRVYNRYMRKYTSGKMAFRKKSIGKFRISSNNDHVYLPPTRRQVYNVMLRLQRRYMREVYHRSSVVLRRNHISRSRDCFPSSYRPIARKLLSLRKQQASLLYGTSTHSTHTEGEGKMERQSRSALKTESVRERGRMDGMYSSIAVERRAGLVGRASVLRDASRDRAKRGERGEGLRLGRDVERRETREVESAKSIRNLGYSQEELEEKIRKHISANPNKQILESGSRNPVGKSRSRTAHAQSVSIKNPATTNTCTSSSSSSSSSFYYSPLHSLDASPPQHLLDAAKQAITAVAQARTPTPTSANKRSPLHIAVTASSPPSTSSASLSPSSSSASSGLSLSRVPSRRSTHRAASSPSHLLPTRSRTHSRSRNRTRTDNSSALGYSDVHPTHIPSFSELHYMNPFHAWSTIKNELKRVIFSNYHLTKEIATVTRGVSTSSDDLIATYAAIAKEATRGLSPFKKKLFFAVSFLQSLYHDILALIVKKNGLYGSSTGKRTHVAGIESKHQMEHGVSTSSTDSGKDFRENSVMVRKHKEIWPWILRKTFHRVIRKREYPKTQTSQSTRADVGDGFMCTSSIASASPSSSSVSPSVRVGEQRDAEYVDLPPSSSSSSSGQDTDGKLRRRRISIIPDSLRRRLPYMGASPDTIPENSRIRRMSLLRDRLRDRVRNIPEKMKNFFPKRFPRYANSSSGERPRRMTVIREKMRNFPEQFRRLFPKSSRRYRLLQENSLAGNRRIPNIADAETQPYTLPVLPPSSSSASFPPSAPSYVDVFTGDLYTTYPSYTASLYTASHSHLAIPHHPVNSHYIATNGSAPPSGRVTDAVETAVNYTHATTTTPTTTTTTTATATDISSLSHAHDATSPPSSLVPLSPLSPQLSLRKGWYILAHTLKTNQMSMKATIMSFRKAMITKQNALYGREQVDYTKYSEDSLLKIKDVPPTVLTPTQQELLIQLEQDAWPPSPSAAIRPALPASSSLSTRMHRLTAPLKNKMKGMSASLTRRWRKLRGRPLPSDTASPSDTTLLNNAMSHRDMIDHILPLPEGFTRTQTPSETATTTVPPRTVYEKQEMMVSVDEAINAAPTTATKYSQAMMEKLRISKLARKWDNYRVSAKLRKAPLAHRWRNSILMRKLQKNPIPEKIEGSDLEIMGEVSGIASDYSVVYSEMRVIDDDEKMQAIADSTSSVTTTSTSTPSCSSFPSFLMRENKLGVYYAFVHDQYNYMYYSRHSDLYDPLRTGKTVRLLSSRTPQVSSVTSDESSPQSQIASENTTSGKLGFFRSIRQKSRRNIPVTALDAAYAEVDMLYGAGFPKSSSKSSSTVSVPLLGPDTVNITVQHQHAAKLDLNTQLYGQPTSIPMPPSPSFSPTLDTTLATTAADTSAATASTHSSSPSLLTSIDVDPEVILPNTATIATATATTTAATETPATSTIASALNDAVLERESIDAVAHADAMKTDVSNSTPSHDTSAAILAVDTHTNRAGDDRLTASSTISSPSPFSSSSSSLPSLSSSSLLSNDLLTVSLAADAAIIANMTKVRAPSGGPNSDFGKADIPKIHTDASMLISRTVIHNEDVTTLSDTILTTHRDEHDPTITTSQLLSSTATVTPTFSTGVTTMSTSMSPPASRLDTLSHLDADLAVNRATIVDGQVKSTVDAIHDPEMYLDTIHGKIHGNRAICSDRDVPGNQGVFISDEQSPSKTMTAPNVEHATYLLQNTIKSREDVLTMASLTLEEAKELHMERHRHTPGYNGEISSTTGNNASEKTIISDYGVLQSVPCPSPPAESLTTRQQPLKSHTLTATTSFGVGSSAMGNSGAGISTETLRNALSQAPVAVSVTPLPTGTTAGSASISSASSPSASTATAIPSSSPSASMSSPSISSSIFSCLASISSLSTTLLNKLTQEYPETQVPVKYFPAPVYPECYDATNTFSQVIPSPSEFPWKPYSKKFRNGYPSGIPPSPIRTHTKDIAKVFLRPAHTNLLLLNPDQWRNNNSGIFAPSLFRIPAPDELAEEVRHVAFCHADTNTKYAHHFTHTNMQVLSSNTWAQISTIQSFYVYALRNAKHAVYIVNPYVLPPRWFKRELYRAARRGVEVHIMLAASGCSDVPAVRTATTQLYEEFLVNGVRVFEFGQRILHGKYMVVDGRHCCIGSFNLDPYSSSVNLEITVAISDNPEVAGVLLKDVQTELSAPYTKEVTLAQVRSRSVAVRRTLQFAYFLSQLTYYIVQMRPSRWSFEKAVQRCLKMVRYPFVRVSRFAMKPILNIMHIMNDARGPRKLHPGRLGILGPLRQQDGLIRHFFSKPTGDAKLKSLLDAVRANMKDAWLRRRFTQGSEVERWSIFIYFRCLSLCRRVMELWTFLTKGGKK